MELVRALNKTPPTLSMVEFWRHDISASIRQNCVPLRLEERYAGRKLLRLLWNETKELLEIRMEIKIGYSLTFAAIRQHWKYDIII